MHHEPSTLGGVSRFPYSPEHTHTASLLNSEKMNSKNRNTNPGLGVRIYVFCILVIYVHILYIYLPVFMLYILFICLFDSIERIFTVQFTVYVIWWYWLVIWLSWSVVVQIMCKIPAWVQVLFCLWHESGWSNCSAFAIMILAWFLCLFDSIKDIYCTV